MAGGWVKSLHCKSRAFDDVHHGQYQKRLLPSSSSSSASSSSSSSSLYSSSCRKSAQTIKDVIDIAKQQRPKKPRPRLKPAPAPAPAPKLPQKAKAEACPNATPARARTSAPARTARAPEPTLPAVYPALTELPEGHPSRNVVEIIFHTSWGPKPFAGGIDVILKVQNGQRTAARFEEYRELVKSRAGSGGPPGDEDARCAADGNEMMRFRCMGPTAREGGAWDCSAGWAVGWGGGTAAGAGKGAAICTFDGSGRAHESAGGGRGRRAMLVCRVIAGRASKKLGLEPFPDGGVTYDSVSGDDGELLVFDPRAVLPCFLIIYRL
ncbi:hypothetical protein ACJRO7_019518 [Eucalyptus globulus]|uniref:Uncharacterized protein n=1 Tax=Eucalyptus globulus TaxID=34317 RepID=A0ABD3KFS7_EUCGL